MTEEPASEAEAQAEAVSETAEAVIAGKPEVDKAPAETDAVSKTAEPATDEQAEGAPEGESEMEAAAQPEAEAQAEVEAEVQADAQLEPETRAETQPETKVEAETGAEAGLPAQAAEAPGQAAEPEEAEAAAGQGPAPAAAAQAEDAAAGAPVAEERAAEAEAGQIAEPEVEAQAEAETATQKTTTDATATEETATGHPITEETGGAAIEAEPTEAAEAVPEETPADGAEADASEAGATAEAGKAGEAEPSLAVQAAEAQATEEPEEPAVAGAETGEAVEPVEVTTETVTEETTRTSDEEFDAAVAERDDNDGDIEDVLKILGAAGAGLTAGALLSGGGQVVDTTGDRVIIERDGQYFVRKDENELLRRPGSDVRTETFADGSTRTAVERDNGVRVVSIRDPYGYIVRRTRIMPDGREIVLFDDIYEGQGAVDVPPPQLDYGVDRSVPHRRYVDYTRTDRASLRQTLQAPPAVDLERSYSLRQVREFQELRELMPRLDLDNITFDLGSAAITPGQARELHVLGQTLSEILEKDPDEAFLIEGHTDAVGGRVMNLALSDRRAETVALALTEYYDIPPENLITQGYGEEYLKIETQGAERANRRVTVRRISPLLETTRAR